MSVIKNISSIFFMASLLVVLYFVYVLFKPFWAIIFIAAAITVTFYPWYQWLLPKVRNNQTVAAALMCVTITILVILPLIIFLGYLSKSSLEAYRAASVWIENGDVQLQVEGVRTKFVGFVNELGIDVNKYLSVALEKVNSYVLIGVGDILKGTTQVITDIFLIIITMFFLFRDGCKLLVKIMRLTPLNDKYDKEVFAQFKDVSYSAIISTLVTGFVQGITVAIALAIVGVPVLVLAMATVFASFIPFVGAALVWGPVVIFLLIQAKWWSALFVALWGGIVVSGIDNLLRPYLMKGNTAIHPMILFFAIFGGITFFGFWGIIFGPLIVAIALTLLHMYEVEYNGILYGDLNDPECTNSEKPRERKIAKNNK